MNAIETNHLTKFYGSARGIEDLELTVEQGDFFGFIGPNGAGKSTTIRTLLGLISPTSGDAKVLGLDIRKDKTEILNRVGYLPSEITFYPGMKVKDVLRLSAGLRRQNCDREAEALCRRLQLDQSRRVEDLSLGNRKKVGIVCALQHNPELLILDEATSGLDPLMQRAFFEILQERNKAGVTVFLSSHVLSEIQRNCTRAAIIRGGKVITSGAVSELARSSARRVQLRGELDLTGLTGIRDLSQAGGSLSFLYSGALQPLLARLSQSEVQDLTIAEPDLEEIFLHYYETEEEK
ncbi:MAG: ABC transporter ATP-binding protein [Clostridiales bacterium]|nr:ABC transporter ATP-binding protein [Clostridiales bacterium]